MKKVAVIMGSDSDLPVVKKATDILKELEIPFEVHVYSAHRTPEQARDEVKMVVEGIRTAKAAHHLAEKYNVDMPIVNEAYQILFEGKNPSDAVLDLMCRSEKNEDDNFYKN